MTPERRRYSRKSWTNDITFQIAAEDSSELKKITCRGEAADISAGGIRIKSDSLLAPGLMVFFGETGLSGVVKWSGACGTAYSAGIQLF